VFSVQAFAGLRPRASIGNQASWAQALGSYELTLDKIAKADPKSISGLKESVAKLLGTDSKKLTILSHPDKETAWFGGVAIFVEPEGVATFVDASGRWFSENLKDRLVGGTVGTGPRSALFTMFYGKPGDPNFYTAYWGTTKCKIISFNLERSTGTISGSVQLPNGKRATISRKGRDNKTFTLNGLVVDPLFL